jgi:hypothetical protein
MVIDSQIFDYFKKLVDQDKDAIIDQIETEEEVK